MSAALKFAPYSSRNASRSGASHHGAAGQLAGRDLTSRPALSSHRPSDNGQYAENEVINSMKPVSVKPETIVSLTQIAEAAKSRPAKEMARRAGLSPSRIYDLRSARFGVTYAHLMALAQAYPSLRVQIIAALSGEAEAGSPQAINDIVRRA